MGALSLQGMMGAKFKLTFFLVTPQHPALENFLRASNKVCGLSFPWLFPYCG
jgi:hypothetical protein